MAVFFQLFIIPGSYFILMMKKQYRLKNELININDQKYRYVGAFNTTQIRLTKSKFLGREIVILDTSKIETFRTHKVRFSGRNALKKGFKGFKVGFGFGVVLGVAFPFGNDSSITEKVLEDYF